MKPVNLGAEARPKALRLFFTLAALEAGAAFVALVLVPGEGALSISRLGLLGLLGAFGIAAAWFAVRLPRAVERLIRRQNAVAAAVAAVLIAITLFLLRYLRPELSLPYYERLSPLLWYSLALCVQLLILILILCYGLWPAALHPAAMAWRASAFAFGGLMFAYVFVALTRIGLTPDSAYWAEPGVPVLGWQLGLALLVAAALLVFARASGFISRRSSLLALGIWLLAVVVWVSVPNSVMKNSFYGPITPPTNMSLPNSDAGYYDSMAHSLLIGYPYQGDIPTRPLYILLLTMLHLLVGQRYDLIILGQTLVLALIPVVLFLIGQRLHSSAAGVIASLFAIFREWNSLLISSQTRVSNTKTLLVDLPTLLLLLVAVWAAVRWLQRRGRLDALLAGGLLGLLFLLRTQTLLLLPAVLLVVALVYGLKDRRLVAALAFFGLGLAAALLPWLIHNYIYTGQVTLDAPFEYQVIASQYKYTGNLDLASVDLEGKGVLGLLVTFALRDPRFVLGFILSHFLATLIGSVLALPLAAPYNGLLAPLNLYWMAWPEHIDLLNAVLLVPYLAVIALGIGSAWRRVRWVGLVPLACALAYAAANGIGRFSGWRYDLPADWVAYFYFAIGAAELLQIIVRVFGGSKAAPVIPRTESSERGTPWRSVTIALSALALVGSLPWMAERLARPRYSADTLPALMYTLSSSSAVQALNVTQAEIGALLTDPQATLQVGRVLYPRYFSRGKGIESAHPWPAYAPRDFPRMGFVLLNQSRHELVMPLGNWGAAFEQGSDAIVLGCQRKDYIEVQLILFPATGRAYTSGPFVDNCR